MKRKVPHHLSGSTTAVRCAQTRNLASQDFRVATAKGFEWWTTWQKQEEQSKSQNLVKIGMVSGLGFSFRNSARAILVASLKGLIRFGFWTVTLLAF